MMLATRQLQASSLLRENTQTEKINRLHPSKTPAKALKSRAALQENFLNGQATVDPKEKRNGAKTPFRPDCGHDSSSLKSQAILAARPLVDKTPLPNRQLREALHSPLSNAGKLSKLSLPAPISEQEDHTTPPPSSSRRKLRIPSNSIRFLQATPVSQVDLWNISDISIELANSSLGDVTEEVNESDYSDIEYMPPTAIEPYYEPPFPLPDYKELGANLLKVARSHVIERQNTYLQKPEYFELSELPETSEVGLRLSSLEEDDPFKVARRVTKTTKVARGGISKSTIQTRSMAKSKSPLSAQSNEQAELRVGRRPMTSMHTRRVATPKSTSSNSRPATALSGGTKPSALRRTAFPSKSHTTADRKGTADDDTLLFIDDSPTFSEFRFSV